MYSVAGVWKGKTHPRMPFCGGCVRVRKRSRKPTTHRHVEWARNIPRSLCLSLRQPLQSQCKPSIAPSRAEHLFFRKGKMVEKKKVGERYFVSAHVLDCLAWRSGACGLGTVCRTIRIPLAYCALPLNVDPFTQLRKSARETTNAFHLFSPFF